MMSANCFSMCLLRSKYRSLRNLSSRCREMHLQTGPTVSVVTPAIQIVEVGPRDGLQNERNVVVSVADKVRLINKLQEAGCRRIEVGSFVSPKAVPAMANTSQVLHQLQAQLKPQCTNLPYEISPIQYSCLVAPHTKYIQQAKEFFPRNEIAIFVSASETFSQRNLQCSIAESLELYRGVVHEAKQQQQQQQQCYRPYQCDTVRIRAYLSCVIACPYEGPIAPTKVAHVLEQLLQQIDCYEISLGDTIGVGTTTTCRNMLREVSQVLDAQQQIALHFHDTYGQALTNLLACLEHSCGSGRGEITTIDAAVAGLGGCPYAPGASGNVATEDVVFMLHGMGVETGIDLDKLAHAGDFISRDVLGRPSASKAGIAQLAQQRLRNSN